MIHLYKCLMVIGLVFLFTTSKAQLLYNDYKQIKFSPQNNSYVAAIENNTINGASYKKFSSKVIEIPFLKTEPFLGVSVGYKKSNASELHFEALVSTSNDGINWSSFIKMPDAHNELEMGNNVNSDLYFFDKQVKYLKFIANEKMANNQSAIDSLQISFISPGIKANGLTTPNSASLLRTDACPCPQPTYRTRTDWQCPIINVSYSYTTVTHLIVHHSDGANTSSDWDAVVRAIFTYHTQTNGWSDIAYNWLIAPNGVLYEGRGGGNNVIGAHFCGTNSKTMGVCMLGTYTTASITAQARAMLVDILAWKCCNNTISPTGTSLHTGSNLMLNNISGHRDGCATDCPGNTTYADLPAIRIDVNNKINNITNISSLKINPNPASSQTILSFNSTKLLPIAFNIFNADGKLVYRQVLGNIIGNQNIPINVKGFAKGSYNLNLISGKERATIPLLVQ